jgi:hypothetical protein
MRKTSIFISLILLVSAGVLVYLYKCTSMFDKMGGKDITEGVIEYDITYPKLDPNSMMASGLPSKAYLRFKDNNISNDMSGMMGMISITYISKAINKAVEQRLTLITKKYASEVDASDLKRLNDSYVSNVEETKNEKQIAGFKCKEAVVKLTDGSQTKVYYTNDIGIENPNWSNPYSKIDGVLMDFQMERYGIAMHFKAKSVLAQKIDDSTFTIPADSTEYKITPFNELEKILEELNPN